MSAPIRFLAVVLVGWAGVRAVTLGAVPGFTVSYAKDRSSARLPPIVATEFPPLPAVEPTEGEQFAPQQLPASYPAYGDYPGYPGYPPMRAPARYYPAYAYDGYAPAVPAERSAIPKRPKWQLSSASNGLQLSSQTSAADDWQLAGFPALPREQSRPVPVVAAQPLAQPKLDRVQLTTWALYRGVSVPGSLATGGTLGGSQAGMRLTYSFNRWLAASLRTTSPLGGSRGAEVAAGVRMTPFRSIPFAITAERRQAFGHGGGRSDFALFAEAGLYHRPMPLDFSLDAYLQAGIVGVGSRDLFADGALTFTRPVWGRVSAGLGVWGGAQPGVYRLDAGPRISVRLRKNLYAHLDWRQRLAGRASPSSGPALTLAADF